jgi:hypothetical protein
MPGGWIVELRGRRACQTLMLCERFAVAIEDEAAALSAVWPFSKDLLDVRITAKTSISENVLNDLKIGPGGVRRH